MNLVLLTHERELTRPTNTGQLAVAYGGAQCRRVTWSRVTPDSTIKRACEAGEALLLFPATAASASSSDELMQVPECFTLETIAAEVLSTKMIILLDATWQEARKMVRQSPYLLETPRLVLSAAEPSRYHLRRNQLAEGLCTVECVIALLSAAAMQQQEKVLMTQFEQFMLDNR